MKEVIRLTNKTAIALRKNAARLRTMYLALGVAVSAALAILGVYLGFSWLPAVPIMIAVIAAIDCLIAVKSRSDYLMLLGQAICTEAAARDMKDGAKMNRRRNQALADLMNVKEDALSAGKKTTRAAGVKPFFEHSEESDLNEEDEDYEPPRDDEEDEDMRPYVAAKSRGASAQKAEIPVQKAAAGAGAERPVRRRRPQQQEQNTLLFIKK